MPKRRPRSSSRAKQRPAARRTRRGSASWLRWAVSRTLVLSLVSFLAYVVYLDITIRNRFEGERWPVPAHVYTRPLELYQGLRLDRTRLVGELDELGYRRRDRAEQTGSYALGKDRVDVYARPFVFWDTPRAAQRFTVSFEAGRVRGLAGRGGQLGLVRLEPRLFGSVSPARHEDRHLVSLDRVPKHLIAALLAVEDRQFFQHHGIDPRGLARALWANLTAGEVVQGGSTVTQQLVKNFYLNAERTVRRKLVEMLMATLLEIHYEKREILEAYVNEVYLGQAGHRAIHGFGLGSVFYFGRPLAELNLPETAMLVGLVKGPSHYHPRRHPQRARQRRDLVLAQMLELGLIDESAAQRATRATLGVAEAGAQPATAYPAFLDFVRLQLRRDYRERDLRAEGLRVFTTLDPLVQQVAETAVRTRLAALERARQLAPGQLEAAAVVVRRDSGEVVALVGGRQPGFAGFNRALDARRPVGSLIKPAVYLAALEQPRRFTLATLLEDTPLRVEQRGSPAWTPSNYDRRFHGPTPLIHALARSYNVATARLGLEVGVDRVIGVLRRLGVDRELQPLPSLLLGAVDMAPVEVAQLYLTLAGNGFRTPLRSISSVLSQAEQPLARYPLSVEQVVEPGPMALLDYALQEVVRTGTGRTLTRRLNGGVPVSGKTGTTDDFRDSWFAGYAGDYLTVVWVGRDDNQPTGLSGAAGAMTIWTEIMDRLDLQASATPRPADIEQVLIDLETGGLADTGCRDAVLLPFIAGSAPSRPAPCAAAPAASKVRGRLRNWIKRLFDRP